MTNNNPLIPDVPFHPGPVYKPLPELIKQNISYPQSSQSSANIDIYNIQILTLKKTLNFMEGVMSKTF